MCIRDRCVPHQCSLQFLLVARCCAEPRCSCIHSWPTRYSYKPSLARSSFEVLGEEFHGALPRLLGRAGVVLEHVELALVGGLVGEGVLGVVAVELELDVRGLQLLLQLCLLYTSPSPRDS